MRRFTTAACAAHFAAAGKWVGWAVHGGESQTQLASAGGVCGGFVIAGAAWQAGDLWKASPRVHPGGTTEAPGT